MALAFIDLVGTGGRVEWGDLCAGRGMCGLNFPISSKGGSMEASIELQPPGELPRYNLNPFHHHHGRKRQPLQIERCRFNKQGNLPTRLTMGGYMTSSFSHPFAKS